MMMNMIKQSTIISGVAVDAQYRCGIKLMVQYSLKAEAAVLDLFDFNGSPASRYNRVNISDKWISSVSWF